MKSLMDFIKNTEFQECCVNHCRDWIETKGWLPASNHSPMCPSYKEEKFYKIVAKGTKAPSCIVESQKEIEDCFSDGEEYDISEIMMTRDQYEHLDEFEGF
jgi:hypothetical protein